MYSSIASCAIDSVRVLNGLWDVIGVDSAERGVLLARVAAEVEAVYKSRVGSERLRQECLLGEIQALRTTISDMMVSLEESVVVVSALPPPLCLGCCPRGSTLTAAPPTLPPAPLTLSPSPLLCPTACPSLSQRAAP